MRNVHIGIIGLGTVGSGVYELLRRNGTLLRERLGIGIEVWKVADRGIQKKEKLGIPDMMFTQSAEEVVNDAEVEILVELIGGTTAAKELMVKAIRNGKHIVTANKALLAEHPKDIVNAVVKNRVELGFEGSVAGGIPIVKTIKEALVANRIYKIIGILNGTTNFILSKMTKEGFSFAEALRIAQGLGFAEANPHLDISGGDARHKITILASLAFNTMIDIKDVYVEGIDHIDGLDIRYAAELGFVTKLLAIAERKDSGVFVRVHPALISRENPLAAISGEDNAIMVYSDYLGKSMYSGKGAGAKPTASAVVSDIVDIALKIKNTREYNAKSYSFFQNLKQLEFDMCTARYYFRFNALDKPGVLSKISGILGKNGISISSVIQKETKQEHESVPLVITSYTARESDVQRSLEEITHLHEIKGESRLIRIID